MSTRTLRGSRGIRRWNSRNIVLFLVALVVALLVAGTTSTRPVIAQQDGSRAQHTVAQHSRGRIIDGAINPELISDYHAYSMLFRFISNRVGHEVGAISAYLRTVGMTRECKTCLANQNSAQEQEQISKLIAAGQEFYNRTRPLDIKLAEVLNKGSSPQADAEAARLRLAKEAVCSEIVASLPSRLGPADTEKVGLHVQGMKRNMKVAQ